MKVALISLAREGSKRIPKKNFKDFCGRPLIHYTLEVMNQLKAVKKYESYIFTNFPEINDYTKKYFPQINIMNMPKKYGKDKHILMESLRYIHKKVKADMYVLLQPTSPLRFAPVVDSAIDIMIKNKNLKSGFTVFELPKKYYWADGIGNVNFNQNIRDGNGCEKKPLYVENGSIYIFRKEGLKEKHVISAPYTKFVDKFIFDLDTEEEWKQAEKFYYLLETKSKEIVNEN